MTLTTWEMVDSVKARVESAVLLLVEYWALIDAVCSIVNARAEAMGSSAGERMRRPDDSCSWSRA